MSTYKESNYNDDISNVSDLPFDEMCLFLEWTKSTKQRQKNRQSICYSKQSEKMRCKCFDIVLGSDSLKNKHSIIKVDVSSDKLTYLFIGWWWSKYFLQHTKKWVIMMIFPMYLNYPLMKCVSFLMNEVDDTVPKEPTICMFLKTIW